MYFSLWNKFAPNRVHLFRHFFESSKYFSYSVSGIALKAASVFSYMPSIDQKLCSQRGNFNQGKVTPNQTWQICGLRQNFGLVLRTNSRKWHKGLHNIFVYCLARWKEPLVTNAFIVSNSTQHDVVFVLALKCYFDFGSPAAQYTLDCRGISER